MSSSSNLHSAIFAAWEASGLNSIFRAYWATADRSEFPVLHDTEATAAQPFPYVVLKVEEGSVATRMTAGTAGANRNELREVPWEVHIYARSFVVQPTKSAKQIAAELADEVLKIFGGHATVVPTELSLSVGAVVQTAYVADFGMREGSQEHSWHVKYKTLLDVPVAA